MQNVDLDFDIQKCCYSNFHNVNARSRVYWEFKGKHQVLAKVLNKYSKIIKIWLRKEDECTKDKWHQK